MTRRAVIAGAGALALAVGVYVVVRSRGSSPPPPAATVSTTHPRTDVPTLVASASSQDPAAARAAAQLGAISDPAAAEQLALLAAGSGDTLVRANAARALGKSGGPEQAPVLARLVGDPAQPARVRQEAALALASMGRPDDVAALAAALDAEAKATTPEAEQIRISIVQALGAIHSDAARAALARHAARDLSTNERAFVSRALPR